MKFHFDPNQQFQLDAINSIVDIFEGQQLNQRISEKQKIKCGYAHFNEFDNVEYKQVSTVGDL